MDPATTAAAIKIAKKLIEVIRKDQANRYVLNADWVLPQLDIPVPDYESDRFRIVNSVITVKAYTDPDTCDGASLAPDQIGSWKLAIATLFHDPWYLDMDAIAQAWGWPVPKVRALGDRIFYGLMLAISPGIIARTYYRFVRAIGGIFHTIAALTCLAAVCASIGCCIPKPLFDPDAVPMPDYTKTAQFQDRHTPFSHSEF